MRIKLANGCSCSRPEVHPKTWQRTNASIKKNWYIHFRFYDPAFAEQYPNGYQKKVKKMNSFKSLGERQDATTELLDELMHLLTKRGYNPITNYIAEDTEPLSYEISPDTGILDALEHAREKKKATKSVKKDLKSVLKYVAIAAKELHLDRVPVKDVRRKHIKALLEHTGTIKRRLEERRYAIALKNPGATPSELIKRDVWSANNFNFYRAHLMMLFDELCQWETIENNPINYQLKKEKHTKARRRTLTNEQRGAINDGLYKDNYRFWRLVHLFFSSGARETEFVLIKWEDVDLDNQEVRYTIKKGTGYRQEMRQIPHDVLPLWCEVKHSAKRGQYLFCKDLKPGNIPISSSNAFTRRWKRWVKNKKNPHGENKYGEAIADIYSLKHSHSTELARRVGTKLAAIHNQHTEEILKRVYDVDGITREKEILKGISISFRPDHSKKVS